MSTYLTYKFLRILDDSASLHSGLCIFLIIIVKNHPSFPVDLLKQHLKSHNRPHNWKKSCFFWHNTEVANYQIEFLFQPKIWQIKAWQTSKEVFFFTMLCTCNNFEPYWAFFKSFFGNLNFPQPLQNQFFFVAIYFIISTSFRLHLLSYFWAFYGPVLANLKLFWAIVEILDYFIS